MSTIQSDTPLRIKGSKGVAPDNSRDVFFAFGIVAILAILFLPLPTFLIDLGLAVSIALSVLILMVALWIQRPLEFSAFPTILLIATMLRLSLNIATTRSILANGDQGEEAAGHVIGGFARFVMSGDFVIGLIVFAILVIINFIVISKGATRIAEVSARFTLDAIPGKQMAIDADLNAGLISSEEAQHRRRELEEESQFFGAMDGASKFVRGDAIAGLIITGINILGGIIIGTMRHDMPLGEAADIYTKLSVGDGLVSQMPALVVSVAAGLLVSKGGVNGAAHTAVLAQFSNYPKALMVASSLMLMLGFAPGLPLIPFAFLAACLAVAATIIPRKIAEQNNIAVEEEREKQALAERDTRDSVKSQLHVAKIELALGRQLSAKLLAEHGELGSRVGKMRKRFARDFGFVIPDIVMSDDLELAPKEYAIRIHGTSVAAALLPLGELTAILGDKPLPDFPCTEIREPAFGLRAITVPAAYGMQLRRLGLEAIDDVSILLTHLSETLNHNLGQLLSYRDLRTLLDRMEPEYQRLIDEICPTHISYSGLQAVLKLLLAEQISIRNLNLILEAVAEAAPHIKRPEPLVEHVRTRLSAQICGDLSHKGALRIVRLGQKWDSAFQTAIRRDVRGDVTGFDFEPADIEAFGLLLREKLKPHLDDGRRFVLVTAPEARLYVRMIAERLFPSLPVLSHGEMARGIKVDLIGSLD